jgi:SOS-response transcriptional repressor LexA
LASGDFLLGAMLEKSYISRMADPVRDLIRNEAERRGESLSSLSKKIGKNHAYLQQFLERGVPKSLPEDVRPDLAILLGVEESRLRNGTGNKGNKPKVRDVTGYRSPLPVLGERDVHIFAAAEAGGGTMVVSTEPLETVQRPWYLRDVRDGFGVLIVGESMIPVYEPGDIVIINPRLPPMRGKDVILVAGEHEGEFTATIKRLEGWTSTLWKLRQFNPPNGQRGTFTLSKADWPKALRVVGSFKGS